MRSESEGIKLANLNETYFPRTNGTIHYEYLSSREFFFFPPPPLEYKYIFNEGWWINYNFTPRYATTWLYLINLRRYYNHSSENSKYVFFFFFFPLSAGNEVRISSRIGEDSEISGAACVFGTISRTILKKFVVLKIFYLRLVCRYRLFF